jgi:T5SS/PEP-CTERM-associated repeat protein/autotransporter-associated beta strand protein
LRAQYATSSNGTLFIGFRTTGSSGSATALVLNVGQAAFYRDAIQVIDVGTFGTDIVSLYGSGWYANTGVMWGAMAAVAGSIATNGDDGRTLYGSSQTTEVGIPGSAYQIDTPGSQAPSATQYTSFRDKNNKYLINSTIINSYTNVTTTRQAVADTDSWGAIAGSLNPLGYFPSENFEAAFSGTSASSAVLNIFRLVPSVPLAGDDGQNIGYFSINNDGKITFTPYSLTEESVVNGYSGPWNWMEASGNWDATNNWTSNQVASNGFAVGITGASGGTITNNAISSLSSLTFSNGAGAYTLTGTNAGQTLTISGGITNNSAATQTIDLSIAGAGGVTQSGSGTTVLAKSNSYNGETILSSGAVVIGNNNALGSGSVTVSGASSLIAGVANLSTTNAMALNAATTIDTPSNRWTNAGVLSGSGPLSKIGLGTLTLSGTSTSYSGASTVNTGAMQVTGNLGTGTVTVNNGAALSGTGTVGGVSLQSGGILTGGVDGGVGKLTVSGDLKFSAGGILNWKLANAEGSAGTGYDSFDVRGTLDLTGLTTGSTLQFNILNALGGTTGFKNYQSSEYLVAKANLITGFSNDKFTIGTNGFTNALGEGAFGFITKADGLYLEFKVLGVDPWTGNIAAGSNVISGQTITSTNNAVIGANSSRNGSVAVTNNSIWKVQGNLQVGGSTNGSGTLTIGSGGRIEANGLTISDQRGSRGLVLITNRAASDAISLGAGTVSFGAGNGTIQFAQSNAVTISNAIAGKGIISSTGTGTTTLSGNQAGFTGTNSLSSGKMILASAVTNGGVVNIAGRGTNVVFAMNTNSVLSSTGTHAVAGLLLDNSGRAFKESIKGSVALSPTGVLQKTYTNGQSVAGFGAGIGSGKSFSILAGTAAPNGINTPTLQAKIVNGQLDFHGTTTNAIVMSMKDPSYSTIRNQIQWYDPATKTWKNTIEGNTGNTTASISGMNGKSFAGSFNTFLLTAAQAGILSATEDTLLKLNSLAAAELNVALAKIMGAFGYDSSTKTSWAVINHNSIFGNGSATFTNDDLLSDPVVADLSVFSVASESVTTQAVPEPSTWTFMILGGLTLLFVVRAKSRERI